MASTLVDEADRPTHAVLDAEEALYLASLVDKDVLAAQQRDPSVVVPRPILRALAVLARVAMSASGHADDATTCETSGAGHAGLEDNDAALIMDVVGVPEIATIRDVTHRQARRIAEKVGGTKVGGRWMVRRHDLERAG